MSRRLALATLIAGLAAAAPTLARDAESFKDWWTACDNVRVCTAMGFGPDDGAGAALRIRRDAEAAARPELDVIVGPEESKGVTGPLDLVVDGRLVGRTEAPVGTEDDFRTWTAPEVVLAALPRGEVLVLKVGDREVASVSLAGASAALRRMDDRQARVGGVTALAAGGGRPASAVPPPPAEPVVRAARKVSQEGLTDTPSKAVRAALAPLDCADVDTGVDQPVSARLSPGVILWRMPCWVGAYNITSALVLADETGGNARLADLGGPGPRDERSMATNADFNTDDQTLYSYAKGRGVGDCGVAETHVWTGKAFALLSRSELGPCRGLPGEFWVETWRGRKAP